MRCGFIAARYDVSVYEDETVIEIIDYDYMVDHSGFHNTKKSVLRGYEEEIPLNYQSQSFVKDEFDCHLESELANYVKDEELKSGIYYTFFNFKINWTTSPCTPDSVSEVDSYLEIEADDHTLISSNKAEIKQFWKDYNNETF